jgi:diguanylate cyclase (GGDEF)-like protein
MKPPPLPADEPARLAELRALDVLDTPAEERFDRITRLAKRLFDVPMVAVSLVDERRQWFKSSVGLAMSQTPREDAFCGHAILGDGMMEVPDAAVDERFHDNPLVTQDPGVRFYAGFPIKGPGGSALGTLCLFDHTPRRLSSEDHALLRDLTQMVEQELVSLRLATTDELTGLANRRGFLPLARSALAMCRRARQPAALSFFDLDGLKLVNDRLGHAAGDDMIRGFAEALRRSFRDSDLIARLGGDEFVALFPFSDEDAESAQQRLQLTVDSRNGMLPAEQHIRYSVGTVRIDPASPRDIGAWMGDADALMYQRKRERYGR